MDRPPPLPSGGGWIRALVPVAAAALSAVLAALLGLSERSLVGTPVENQFYGFFLRHYPLFLFAVVYGAVRILVAAAEPGWRTLRAVTAPLALAGFAAASLYPTFGGMVLRAGYMAGGMSFLNGAPAALATLIGAGAAAFAFGAVLGACTILARARLRMGRRALGGAVLGFLALWLGAAVLALAPRLGIDPAAGFPAGPLRPAQGAAAAALVALALLPHALVVAARPMTGPEAGAVRQGPSG